MDRFIVISGCSGGGKSTLLSELKNRGYAVVEEPGRRIVMEEHGSGGRALPWIDPAAFAKRAVAMALLDREHAKSMPGIVFFDRGLIDAAAALEHVTGEPTLRIHASERYNQQVFLAPPWPEIYANDADRRHGLKEAIEEYERLLSAYATLDYLIEILPKTDVARRADIIIGKLRPTA